MNYTGADMRSRLKTLPETVRGVLVAVETADALIEIGTQHGLSGPQQKRLGGAVGLVLLGYMQPNTFTSAVAFDLGLQQLEAQKIAREINTVVFDPIRSPLKELYAITVWDIGMGPEQEFYVSPPSLWSSMKDKRGDTPTNIFDAMKKQH